MTRAAIMSALLLSACAVPVARPMPLAESGPVAIDLNAASYMVDLQPVPGGATLAVTRDVGLFGYADGLEAKRAAAAFCAKRGARINPAAFGRFAGGSWLFAGGCV